MIVYWGKEKWNAGRGYIVNVRKRWPLYIKLDWIYLYIKYIIYNVIVIDWNDARYNARIKTSSYWYVIIYIKITQIAIIRIGRDTIWVYIVKWANIGKKG